VTATRTSGTPCSTARIRLSAAIEQVALVLSEPEMPDNTPIVRASSLLHPR